jgi:hypothetical protein
MRKEFGEKAVGKPGGHEHAGAVNSVLVHFEKA